MLRAICWCAVCSSELTDRHLAQRISLGVVAAQLVTLVNSACINGFPSQEEITSELV